MGDAPLKIEGKWQKVDGEMVASPECRLIDHLVQDHLILVAQREGGWTSLYRDPTTGQFWELTYKNSEQHGGGPQTLTQLSLKEASEKYHPIKVAS